MSRQFRIGYALS